MFGPHFFLLPYPPGFEPPHLSLWFCLTMISLEMLGLLMGVCLAALQLERQRMRTARNTSTVA
jgi:hypothetical protein